MDRQKINPKNVGQFCRPSTPAEWVAQFDTGYSVWSIEMGGIGPGYEQAIQETAVAIVRACLDASFDDDDFSEDKWEETRSKITISTNKAIEGMGLSGAQFGAAMSLALAIYKRGTKALDDDEVKERRIQFSRDFPRGKKAETSDA